MTEIWLAPEDTALVIVDVQNDFCPGGNLAVAGGDDIIPLVNRLKPSFMPVVLTQDWHPQNHSSFASNHESKNPLDTTKMNYGTQILWPDHCVQGSEGAQFHKDLFIQPHDLILRKGTNTDVDSYSGFYEADGKGQPIFDNGKTLTETFREQGIKRIVFVGLAYDFCVGWHALDAVAQGFKAIILKDLTCSIAMPLDGGLNSEQAMTKQLEQAGVKIIDSSELMDVVGKPNPGPVPVF